MRDVILHIQEGQCGNHIEPKLWEIVRDKHVGGTTGRFVGEISDLLERENIYYMEDAKLIDTGLNYMRKELRTFTCKDESLPAIVNVQEKEWTRWRSRSREEHECRW